MITKKFSTATKKLIADCRVTAIRYNNDYIALSHFYLIYNRYRKNDIDFKISISDQKELLKYIKGVNFGGDMKGPIFLTKEFEKAIQFSDFHKWVLRDKLIEPKHICLAALAEKLKNKNAYFDYLKKNNIELGKFRNFIVRSFFNPFIKKTGLRKVYK